MTDNQTSIDYTTVIDELNSKIEQLTSEIESLTNDKTSMQNAIDNLNIEKNDLTEEISHLKSVNYDLFMRGYSNEKVENEQNKDIDDYTDLATLLNDVE